MMHNRNRYTVDSNLELSVIDFKIIVIINIFKKINDKIKGFKWNAEEKNTTVI